jgi:MATE family multidrug resistance protein
VVAVSLAGAAAFLYDGIYIGATATRPLRNNMLWATALVYFPLLWFGLRAPSWGNHAVWGAMTAFMAARSIGLGWRMKAIVRRAALAGGGDHG